MGGKRYTGVEARGGTVRITFHLNGQRRRETLRIPPTDKNLKYASLKRQQILYEIETGRFDYAAHFPESPYAALGGRKQYRVKEAVETWMKTRVITPSTLRGYNTQIRTNILPQLGDRDCSSILASELEVWRAELAATKAPKTVNNAMLILRGAFDLAHADGMIDRNPAARLTNVKNSRRSHADPFTLEEIGKLLAKCHEPSLANIIDFWWTTGLRPGELIALSWEDIGQHQLHIRRAITLKEETDGKNHGERFVEIGEYTHRVLNRQKAITKLSEHGRVFINDNTGQPMLEDQIIYRKFKDLCRRAEVRYRKPYQLRHTYASLALSACEPPLFVAKQLGHTSLQMLERHYAKWMAEARSSGWKSFDDVTAAAWGIFGANQVTDSPIRVTSGAVARPQLKRAK